MSTFDGIRFQPSRPLLKELSAERLNAILSEIRKNRVRGERGITVRQSGDATYIGLAATIKNRAAGSISRPFQIVTRTSEDGEQTFLGITPRSYVYTFFGTFAESPSGVLSDIEDAEDPGWRNANGITLVWLEYDTENGLSVEFGDSADFDLTEGPWEEKSIFEDDGDLAFPIFKKARKLIATITEEDDALVINQHIENHQIFFDVVVDGRVAGYWFDWSGGVEPDNV